MALPGGLDRLHRVVSAVANRLAAPESVFRRLLSPVYGAALRLLARDTGIEVVVNGERFRIDPGVRAAVPSTYEPEVLRILRARLRPGACVVDVGANIGLWVLHAARLTAPAGRVIAFEPNPATAGVLRRHLRMNGFDARVVVETAALAAKPGTARLYGVAEAAGTSRLHEGNPEGARPASGVAVPVTTLDEYCAARALRPSLVLIDVEGLEGDVLEGATRTIGSNPELTVIVEMHPTLWGAGEEDRLRDLLGRLGRTARGISGQDDPLRSYGQVVLEPADGASGDEEQVMAETEKSQGSGAFPVSKTEGEWRAQLTPEQFAVLRQHATERPGSCALLHEKRPGTFKCAGCGQPLFVAHRKFESGTGWPSFFAPVEGSIGTTEDRSHFMVRTEVHCSRCGGHLGHVFPDGPPPTGLRYCINGVALEFEPAGDAISR